MNSEHENEEYSFLQEDIKEEKPKTKQTLRFVGRLCSAGLLFGMAACISFCAIKPWVEEAFQWKTKEIEIPQDEEETEVEQEIEGTKATTDLDIDSYHTLENELRSVALEAEKSIVTITGNAKESDFQQQDTKEAVGVAGVIVADNGQELLILANDSVTAQGKMFWVTFCDNKQYEATLLKHAGNLNMVMLSVKKNKIKDDTLSKISPAALGNSNNLLQGKTLLAVGSPFGYDDTWGFGVASSISHSVTLADGKYGIVITDMIGAKNSSGALFDTNGKLMGIIATELADQSQRICGYSISSIKNEIELLSNNKEIPYIGILGTMVTEAISESQNIPQGLYVTEIEKDSPAMKAGIRVGDILTGIDGQDIATVAGYHEVVMKQEPEGNVKIVGRRIGTETYVEIDFKVTVGTKH